MLSKKLLTKTRSRIPIGAFLALALLGVVTLNPLVVEDSSTVHAKDQAELEKATNYTNETGSSTPVAQALIETGPSLSLKLDDQILRTSIDPTDLGKFIAQSTTVHISIAESSGYDLYLSGTPELTGALASNTTKITGVANATTPEHFLPNTWGYNITATNNGEEAALDPKALSYYPVREDRDPIDSMNSLNDRTSITAEKSFALHLGAKFDTTIPADTYKGQVTLSLVAKPYTIATSFDDVIYMQEMTPAICRSAQIGDTKRLIDTRDSQGYWVARLADGNCWMTQNLALDITEDGLSSADTDIAADWDQKSEYPPEETNKTDFANQGGYTTTASWNQGLWVTTTPHTYKTCPTNSEGIAFCVENGSQFTNVDGWTPSEDPNFTVNNGSTIDINNHLYDSHYLVGNWYSFNAATASTGIDVFQNENVHGSICPKNWHLPNYTSSIQSNGLDFFSPLSAVGFEFPEDQTVAFPEGFNDAITSSPFFFVRAGRTNAGSGGQILEFDHNSYTWTSTIFAKNHSAYGFAFYGASLARPASYYI